MFFFNVYKFEQSTFSANSEDPDQTSLYVMSNLDLLCLYLSHKKDTRLLRVKSFVICHWYTGSGVVLDCIGS